MYPEGGENSLRLRAELPPELGKSVWFQAGGARGTVEPFKDHL